MVQHLHPRGDGGGDGGRYGHQVQGCGQRKGDAPDIGFRVPDGRPLHGPGGQRPDPDLPVRDPGCVHLRRNVSDRHQVRECGPAFAVLPADAVRGVFPVEEPGCARGKEGAGAPADREAMAAVRRHLPGGSRRRVLHPRRLGQEGGASSSGWRWPTPSR